MTVTVGHRLQAHDCGSRQFLDRRPDRRLDLRCFQRRVRVPVQEIMHNLFVCFPVRRCRRMPVRLFMSPHGVESLPCRRRQAVRLVVDRRSGTKSGLGRMPDGVDGILELRTGLTKPGSFSVNSVVDNVDAIGQVAPTTTCHLDMMMDKRHCLLEISQAPDPSQSVPP